MIFSALEQIQNHAWVGNHASDSRAFDAVDAFVSNCNLPVADRAAALREMYTKGMGLDEGTSMSDEDLVETYLSEQS